MAKNAELKVLHLIFCVFLVLGMSSGVGAVESTGLMFYESKPFLIGPNELFVWEDKCYFAAASGEASNVELWMFNPSTYETKQLRDIRSGAEGSFPRGFVYGPKRKFIYFTADNGTSGEEAWAVDPANGNTWLFMDLNKNPGAGSNPRFLTTEYFSPYGIYGDFRCAADYATKEGNVAQNELVLVQGLNSFLKDIRPGAEGSNPLNITAGRRYYPGSPDYESGKGYWSAYFCSADDGTGKGREFVRISKWHDGDTQTVVDIRPGADSSSPLNFTPSGNYMFFTANDGTNGTELWVDTGYGGQVRMVKNINPGAANSNPAKLTAFGTNSIYFRAFTETDGAELWKSDGTDVGTVRIKDIYPGDSSSMPDHFCMIGDTLFFSATNGVNGRELWSSNGTDGTTGMVKNIREGAESSDPRDFVEMGGKLYFTCDSDGDGKRELWVSDGASGGTVPLITSFIGNSNPRQLTAGDSLLYFTTDNTLVMFDPTGTPPPSPPTNLRLHNAKIDQLVFKWDYSGPSVNGYSMYFDYGFDPPPHRNWNNISMIYQNTWSYSNLSPNKPYSFSTRPFYAASPTTLKNESYWPTPAYVTVWTLSPRPAMIAGPFFGDVWTNNTTIFFDALETIWGEGGVHHYRYIWNTLTSHTFTGVEEEWHGGQILVSIPSSGVYYLHVQSINNAGAPNPDIVSFGPYLIDQTPPDAPDAPVGALYTIPNIVFSWGEAEDQGGSGVASYECQIGTSPGGSNAFSGNVGMDMSKSIAGSTGNTYYCRVRAIDVAGNVGAWSANSVGVVYSDQAGSLKVSISPAMAVISGAAWRRVGTTAWLGSNSIESNVPVGTQIVEFKEINGYLRPGNKTVTINNGEETTSSGTYAKGGKMKVTILPAESVSAGAKWRYDTGFYTSGWFDSGATISVAMTSPHLDVSYFNVQFKDLPTWNAPETIPWAAVYAGQTTELEGENTTYSSAFGAVSVIIAPEEAIDAGAQWKLTSSENWLDSGDTETTVSVGLRKVTFKEIPDWNKPGDAWVIVTKDATATLNGGGSTYAPHTGSLTVNINPEEVRTAGAQWRRIGGGDWKNSGDTETEVPAGQQTVEFSPVNGWVKPDDHDEIGILNGLLYDLTISYTEPTELSARVINHILQRIPLEPTLFLAADVNEDGIIDIADLVMLISQGR